MKRKQITKTIKDENATPRRPRQRKERRKLPIGLRAGMPVRVTNPHQFKGYRLGLVAKPCEKDEGVIVYLTSSDNIAEYACIREELGGTIVPIEKL